MRCVRVMVFMFMVLMIVCVENREVKKGFFDLWVLKLVVKILDKMVGIFLL